MSKRNRDKRIANMWARRQAAGEVATIPAEYRPTRRPLPPPKPQPEHTFDYGPLYDAIQAWLEVHKAPCVWWQFELEDENGYTEGTST